MAHHRIRFAQSILKKLATFWPVVGVIGPRQIGKTTLLRNFLNINEQVLPTFDDFNLRQEASSSPDVFLQNQLSATSGGPVGIDEIQKVPEIFDGIKKLVDQKRKPGRFFITGSVSFSRRIGIRESLTGRIGTIELQPFSLAEIYQKEFHPFKGFVQTKKSRFTLGEVTKGLKTGGMPVPLFSRDENVQDMYWTSWLDTLLLRDLPSLFLRKYDSDFAYNLIFRIATILANGEYPTLKHFVQDARKVRQYLSAMEEVFLLRKMSCHELGTGKEVWMFFDSALANHLMKSKSSESVQLSLVRHFLWKEICCNYEYQARKIQKRYYKSTSGEPVDSIIEGIPVKFVSTQRDISRQRGWQEKAVLGAMKKLKAPYGFLIGPVEQSIWPKKGEVGVLPWDYFC